MIKKKVPMYLQLKNEIHELIGCGIYKAGENLPSIRNLAKEHNISLTTILRAYRELECEGVITAIPQSGFYVTYRDQMYSNENSFEPKNVEIDDIDLDRLVVARPNNKNLQYFGVGRVDPNLSPANQLNTILSRIIHTKGLLQKIQMPVEGYEDLRKQIIKLMYLRNSHTSSEEVIITTNCFSSIQLSLLAICKRNDLIAIESPCNYGALRVFQSLGLRTIEIPASKFGGIDVEKLNEAIDKYDIKVVYVNPNCNNPTGKNMPTQEKEKIAVLINNRKIILIEDDATGELFFCKQRPVSIKSYDTEGRIIYCSSFSKVLPSEYQLGWIIAGQFTKEILNQKRTYNTQVSLLIQMTVAEYILSSSYQKQLRIIRRCYKQKVSEMIADIRHFFPFCPYISNPEGGYQIWVKLPEKLNSIKLYKELIKYNLSIMPGTAFSPNDKFSDYIRLTAALYDENSRKYLEQIGNVIRSLINNK